MSNPRESSQRPLRDTSGPDQVTGDAVRLDVPAAGIAMRVLAGGVDLLVRALTFLGLLFAASLLLGDAVSEAIVAGVGISLMVLCFVLGPAFIETVTFGRSLGKALCGLRVVRTDGGAISFRHALVRAFLGYIETFMSFGMIAFVTAMLTVRSRRLGDLAAGTYVVREVRRLRTPPMLTMPAQLAGWAGGATITPLPAALGASLAQLARASCSPTGTAYRNQAVVLLPAVLPYVSPPPPPGHDPVAVLVALAVLRRDADSRMLEREDAARRKLLTH